MNKLNNYTTIEELRTAKRLLHSKKAALELDMKDDLDSLKDSLKPAKVLSRLVAGGSHSSHNGSHNGSTSNNSPGILSGAGAAVTDLLINDLFLRKSSYIKKFAMSYIIRLLAPILFQKAGPILKTFLNKTKEKI